MKHLGLALLTLAGIAFAGPYDTWSNYRDITVNTTSGGAGVTGAVADFPLVVRLTNASAATGANVLTGSLSTGGADVRFTDSTGQTALSFELENWSSAAATFWVKVPSVAGNASTKIRMYWGKSAQTAASSGAAVFDTANGYRAVYHMSGGTSQTELDATAMANNMAASDSVAGSVPGDTIGMIGRARMFAGDSLTPQGRQYFVAPGTAGKSELNWGPNNPHSISAWVYARDLHKVYNQYGHGSSIFNKGDKQYAMQAYGDTGSRLWEGAIYANQNNGWRQVKSKNKAQIGGWVHLATTWTGGANGTNGTAKLYINGVLDSTTNLAIGTGTSGNNLPVFTYNLYIGANPTGGGTSAPAPGTTRDLGDGTTSTPRFWNGYLDEIALARGARSADFVKLSYETQKSGASAVALGATQTFVAAAITKLAYVDSAKAADTLVVTSGVPASVVPLVVGGPVDSFKVVGNNVTLPAGITVNKTTGAIEGTAQAAFNAANRTIRAWGHFAAGDSISRTVRISAVLGPTSAFNYTKDTTVYVVGIPGEANSPTYSGRAPTAYTVTPALPAGLTLNAATGVITGTPSAAAAAANYVVRGANATDTVTKTLRITVITVGAEAYATGWTGHKDLWLNTQSNGAGVVGNVLKFPVLIRLDSTSFTGAGPAANGADLRFTKVGDVVRLPHQIESWNSATKQATVWVLVDTVYGSNGTQKIRMHWGNASAPSLSSGPTVFDTAAGFQAVWHFNGTADEVDATPNGFNAVAASAPTSAAGAVGPARQFNGTSQYFSVPNSASGALNFSQANSYTLSSWINPAAISTAGNTGHKIIDKGDNQYVLATYGPDATTRYWEITIRGNGAWNQCQADGSFAGSTAILASSSVGSWHHLVGTYTGGAVGSPVTQHLYYDGVLVNQCAITNDTPDGRVETMNVHLGVQAAGTAPGSTFSRYWNGLLDEPRLASRARSADWVKLEYANQRPTGQSLVALTQPVSINGQGGHALIAGGLNLSVKSSANGVMFRVVGAATTDRAVLSLVDMWGRTVFSGAFDQNGQLAWKGASNNGRDVSAGIYIARVTVVDGQSKLRKVFEHKVPFTR